MVCTWQERPLRNPYEYPIKPQRDGADEQMFGEAAGLFYAFTRGLRVNGVHHTSAGAQFALFK